MMDRRTLYIGRLSEWSSSIESSKYLSTDFFLNDKHSTFWIRKIFILNQTDIIGLGTQIVVNYNWGAVSENLVLVFWFRSLFDPGGLFWCILKISLFWIIAAYFLINTVQFRIIHKLEWLFLFKCIVKETQVYVR